MLQKMLCIYYISIEDILIPIRLKETFQIQIELYLWDSFYFFL